MGNGTLGKGKVDRCKRRAGGWGENSMSLGFKFEDLGTDGKARGKTWAGKATGGAIHYMGM
jgi:hypothetical protein